MVPTQRGKLRQNGRIDGGTPSLQFANGAAEIAAVEQDYRGGREIESRCPDLLVLKASIPEASETVEGDRPRQTVARLAFVQFSGHHPAQFRFFEPT